MILIITIFFIIIFGILCYIFSEHVAAHDIKNKHYVITGGSSGIGLECAKELVKQGANKITLMARNEQRLKDACSLLNEERANVANYICVDVCDEDSVEQGFAQCIERFGYFDGAILSAGVSKPALFDQLESSTHRWIMDVNYFGVLYCTKACIKYMLSPCRLNEMGQQVDQPPKIGSLGRVLFISSMAGMSGVAGFSAYSPSKFAVRGLAEVLQMEYRPKGLLFSVVNPPDVDTPMYEEEMKSKPTACRLISEGSGLFSAEKVASDIIEGLKRWSFFISTGFDGIMTGSLGAGTSPAHNPFIVFAETLGLGVIRFVALGYLWKFNRICSKHIPKLKLQ